MYLSRNWLNDFVDIKDIDIKELALRLTMSTAEVEEVMEYGNDINNVVVGKVVEVAPHPDSKKLSITKVDIGNEVLQCVCGAPNVRIGILAPFAKVGGSVKKLEKIGVVKLAGVESYGMLCSASELGISDDHSGILVLEGDYKPGTDIKEILQIDDYIIEIDNKSLTHRPDLWGHYGFAREISALYGRKLKPLPLEEIKNDKKDLDIIVEDKEKCYRYSGLTIDNLTVKKSNINMGTRLYYCGMRPINLLVDLSNYIMLEIGQPTHAFDKKFIQKIIVKSTDKPIKFKTLDGAQREIPQDVLMIYNQNEPVAIAGIMGGESSEISGDSTSVFLESANFEGPSTRKNAVRIGLRTEASARYEKMIDPELTIEAIKRFVKLLREADPKAEVSSNLTDVYVKKYDKISLSVDRKYIAKYMGMDIGLERMSEILKSLSFDVKVENETILINVPSYRATKDITTKVDIVEEIARIHGFDNIEPQTTNYVLEPLVYNEKRVLDHKIKEILSECHGLNEVHSYIWYDNKANSQLGLKPRYGLRVVNSIAGDNETLRDSMGPIMLDFAVTNVKNYSKFGIFEIGSVFSIENKTDACEEHKNLAVLLGSKTEGEDELFLKAKGIISQMFRTIKKSEPQFSEGKGIDFDWIHPIKAIKIGYNGEDFGYISVVHPKIKANIDKKINMVIIEMNMFRFNDIKENIIKYQAPSKYQEVSFDLSFLVDKDIPFSLINQKILEYKNELILEYKFIDIYTGKGIPEDKKSMTYSFRIGSKDHTLSSSEIEEVRQSIISYAEAMGYSLR